jgi:hypothetical protein
MFYQFFIAVCRAKGAESHAMKPNTLPSVFFALLIYFALSPRVQAVNPPPDGGYPNATTAEGTSALFSLTTGINNTAIGFQALYTDTSGMNNVATGAQALFSNTGGNSNTANGTQALYFNTTGGSNTATGLHALYRNTIGLGNTANGALALQANTTGNVNTADGNQALQNNTTGYSNTAIGNSALFSNTTGHGNLATGWHASYFNTSADENTAIGVAALRDNRTGIFNVAVGGGALINTTGSYNIGIGHNGGDGLTFGNYNIDIGAVGVAGEGYTTRIGRFQGRAFIAGIGGVAVTGAPVVVNSPSGQLGVAPSSQRFKDDIKAMGDASDALLGLTPVTFRYKKEIDPNSIPQFGLVAEDVEKVNPDLVLRDADGKVYTVRYEAVNAMLLNEFLKEHRAFVEEHSNVEKLQVTVAQQQKQIEALTAGLQKVSAELEASRPAPQVVNNP